VREWISRAIDQRPLQDHLQNSDGATVFSDPPPICLGYVLHSRRRDGLEVKAIVFEVLDDLRTTHVRFAQVPKEIPQAELKRDLVCVRPLTELLANECIIGVIRLFLERRVERVRTSGETK